MGIVETEFRDFLRHSFGDLSFTPETIEATMRKIFYAGSVSTISNLACAFAGSTDQFIAMIEQYSDEHQAFSDSDFGSKQGNG